MDLREMFSMLLRRWFVLVPALLLTFAGTSVVYAKWPTEYQSEVQLTLLTSRNDAVKEGDAGNPYLAFTTALDAVVDLMGRNLSSDQSINQLKSLGVTDAYTAGIADNAQGPFLAIDVTGKNRAEIMRSMPIIIAFAQRKLAQMQDASAAPKNSLIQMTLIAPPSTPTPVLKTKIELVAGIAVIGLVCSFLLCFVADSILSQRASPRRQRRTDAPADRRRGAARLHDYPERTSDPAQTR
jgi:capsular polysaccharide biosynthesis protein